MMLHQNGGSTNVHPAECDAYEASLPEHSHALPRPHSRTTNQAENRRGRLGFKNLSFIQTTFSGSGSWCIQCQMSLHTLGIFLLLKRMVGGIIKAIK